MLKKTTFIIYLLLICLISLTCVCAQDNITDDIAYGGDFDSDEYLSVDDEDIEILSDSEVGTFSELSQLISGKTGVVNLTKDYKWVSSDSSTSGITVPGGLTINGNGHTIDGSNRAKIFNVNSNNVVLNNITFVNAYGYDFGGAVYSTGNNLRITNSNFNDCYSYYGVVYMGGSNSYVINSTFVKNRGYGTPAIYWFGTRGNLINSRFINNTATGDSGGAVFWQGTNGNIDNSIFAGNTGKTKPGGAIYVYGDDLTIKNSKFYNNTAENNIGGGIYWGGVRGKLSNSEFINNSAKDGGGVADLGHRLSISDTYFEGNDVYSRGGGLYLNALNGNLNNLTFVDNHAYTGGGAYLGYQYTGVNDYSGGTMRNSKFINNTAYYGGGAVDVTCHFDVLDSLFVNNTAYNYGGAVSITNSVLSGATLINNSAYFGGGVYTFNSEISNSFFDKNNATFGSSIYVINTSDVRNNDVLDEDIFNKTAEIGGTVLNDHEITHLLRTNHDYYAYCSEAHNTNPYFGEFDTTMELLRNAINKQPVSEYLKILIYLYVDNATNLRTFDFHNYVWAFTDREYWNSADPMVREVIRIYDSGFRVPTINACKVLPNGTLMYFNFSSMITPSSQQNLFLFKFSYGDKINETLTKEALNKTAFVGDEIEFRIVVSNKGKSPIYDIFVDDSDYSKGLKYENWTAETGNWTYNNKTKQWKLDSLMPAKSASILLFFRVIVNGTLYNNATTGVGIYNVTNATNGTKVYNPNFTVEKISLNQTVLLGEITQFEIVVRNTGDIALTGVFVEEDFPSELVYVDYHKGSLWDYTKVNGKHRWTFRGSLPVDEVTGFTVLFNTTAYGNFTNTVVAGSNETDNKTANNTTKVLKANFTVVKNSLTPYVQVGNITSFEIIVKNTGEVNLEDIVVIEDSYEGLTYDHCNDGGIWTHFIKDGKHAWKLNMILTPGMDEILFVYFKTTRIGNFTNIVVATSNKTDNKTSNNTTVVNETVPDLPEDTANFTVEKVTVNTTVLVGELVEFEIIVKNTGNKKLHNLTVYESKYPGLTYVKYVDDFKMWVFNKDKMSWTLNSTFYPGEEVGFFVIFNTTDTGRYMNTVVVSSNETDNKTSNNNTKVLKPGINVEKITINKTVVKGEQVRFEIVVHNIGEEILDKVTVRELSFEGLIYDHFEDFSDYWVKNDDLSWSLMKKLAPGEYEGFFVIFNSTKRGTFTNVVVVESNDTDNDTNNDSVRVLDYNLTVSKITLTPVVKVGDNAIFEIIVLNNGDLDLENVFVVEDKYDSGLVYTDFYSVDGVWKHLINSQGKHQFNLIDLLKVGKSASFRVVFKTTQVGDFSNTVSAGYNNTTFTNSTNSTEVFNITYVPTAGNSTKIPDEVTNKSDNGSAVENKIKTHKMDGKATGNPIFALLLVLVIIPFRRFRK